MSDILNAIKDGIFEEVKCIICKDPGKVHIKSFCGWTPLDWAIAWGKLEVAKFLWKEGGRPNLKIYCDGKNTPVHCAAQFGYETTLKWAFKEKVLSLDVFNIKDCGEWTPLDVAITAGKLETAKFLFEMGGQPNLDIYHDGRWTPVHWAALCGYTVTLKWVFAKSILPLCVLNIKDHIGRTPLDNAIAKGNLETATLLRRLIHLDPVFLAMQCVKRDYHHQCVLRRLPDELLDMVVDKVAAHFNLVVVWH